MADLEISSDRVQVDANSKPVKIEEPDYQEVQDVQVRADALAKYRQEMGRLFQALNNLKDKANEVEVELSEKRKALVGKYGLDKISQGQWAIDFEKKEFVLVSSSMPVIP